MRIAKIKHNDRLASDDSATLDKSAGVPLGKLSMS